MYKGSYIKLDLYTASFWLSTHLNTYHLAENTTMKTSSKPTVDPLDSMKAASKPPPIDPKEAIKGHQAGDGIRSMEVLFEFFYYFLH